MDKIILLCVLLWIFTEYALRDWKKKHLFNKLCLVPALVAAGTALYGLYQSDQQKKKAKDLKPSNYVPPALREAEATARLESSAPASAMYLRCLEKQRQISASTVNNIKKIGGTPGQIQQSVSDADAREREASKDLEVNNEQFRLARKQDLNRTLQIKGGYEKQSYDDANAAKSALMGASKQNQYNALTTLGEGLVNEYYDSQAKKEKVVDQQVVGSASIRKGNSLGQVQASTADEHLAQLRARGVNPSYAEEARIRKQYEAKQFQSGY